MRRATPDILGDVLAATVGEDVRSASSVAIASIRTDGGTQPREGLDDAYIKELAESLQDGATLPPVDVMYDGERYWLYDGFHRLAAHKAINRVMISARVHQGDQAAAQWESYAANQSHGLRRSPGDKERAIRAALKHPNGAKMSDSLIAKHLGVSNKTVTRYREIMESTWEIPKSTERIGADGRVINTANIGTNQPARTKAPIRHDATLPALNVPAPGAVTASMAAKIPIEDWELEDFVEQVATEYYGKVTRMVGDSMMLAAQSQAGEYWAKLRRVLEPFDADAQRIEAAVAATVERLVGERRALRPGSPEAKQLGREIKSATWSDVPLKQPQRFAEVWELERLLAQWAQPLHATVLRSTANMRSGGMWWDARKALQALGGVNYRDRDLVSALHNLASQKEQRGREGEGETQPAESGREGEGETPAEKLLVDWTDEDWAAYGFEAKAPAVESTEAAEDAAAIDLVVDGDQPLPAWVDGEADKPVTLRDLELAAQAQAAPVSHREGYDSDEWYTPGWVIEAATAVMGQIDLDPASCELAQETVQAGLYWTKQQDGCRMTWFGRVWLNPPYSAPGAFVDKLLDEYTAGNVKQACVLLNNATETKWFQRLLARFPVCFFSQRLAFWRHDHEDVGARQGQALFYLGPDVEKFVEVFGEHGIVVKRLD